MIEAVFAVEKEVAATIRNLKAKERMDYILGKHQVRHFESKLVDMEEFGKATDGYVRKIVFSQDSYYFKHIKKEVLLSEGKEVLWLLHEEAVEELYEILRKNNMDEWLLLMKGLVNKDHFVYEYHHVYERFLMVVKEAKGRSAKLLFVLVEE